ncbi:MAG: ABC transporter permease [Firmicutes bacterium]|nr:ABC transporter permease [Bacillota bacterium]
MWTYCVRRVLMGVVVLAGVCTVTFLLARAVPSDPAARWVGPHATAEQIAQAEKELALDKPLHIQFWRYLTGIVKGDWGKSIRTHQPVLKDLATYVPASLELVVVSTLLALFVGVPLGTTAAVHKDRWPDHLCRLMSVGSVSLPTFWLAMALQFVFFRQLRLLPLGGQLDTMVRLTHPLQRVTGFIVLDCLLTGNKPALASALRHLVLPAVTLAAYPVGLVAKMVRSSLIEILNEDYIRAARSFGIPETSVVYSLALKNALGPTVTVLALSAGYSLVNTFLIEAIFTWPGLGSYTALSVITLDYTAIMGITIFAACTYVLLNLFADIVISLDPRVRT